jgi:uncharacterized protein (TIGR03435 family)
LVVAAAMGVGGGGAQAPTKMSFDVASVRQNKSGTPGEGGGDPMRTNVTTGPGDTYYPTQGVYRGTNVPLEIYIYFAYRMHVTQDAPLKKSLPAWAMEDRFDIQAKTDKLDATKADFRLMMQSLLEERFKLKIHKESREGKVYALILAKPGVTGPRLRPHPTDDKTCTNGLLPLVAKGSGAKMPPEAAGGFPLTCGGVVPVESAASLGKLMQGGRNLTMEEIAENLPGSARLDHPLVDKTGLIGRYDFTLDFAPDPAPGAADVGADDPRPLFRDAVVQQLGLKLELQDGSYEVWVVDSVEHPTAN